MKLEPRRLEAFLADPGAARVVLFHGEDEGQIRELAGRLVRNIAGSLDDPFRVSDVDRDAIGQLPDEVTAMSLTGGRRVVRVRETTDAVSSVVQKILAMPGSELLVLEGAGLGNKSKLKTLLDRSDAAVTVACYPMDSRAVSDLVRYTMAEAQIGIDSEALEWLTGQLGVDRAITRRELEKLALYVGPGGRADMAAAQACVGDLSGLSLEDALFAATEGDVRAADRALELAMLEGASPVGVIRAGLMHLQKLLLVVSAVAAGASADDAIRGLRPPLFYKRAATLTRTARTWSLPALDIAIVRMWEAERQCKRTGSQGDTLCRNAIIGLAQRGAALRRR